MKNEDAPLVSIGLTVFNADKFLRKTMESLLAQDYTKFELIICDNASEDSSEKICREYAAKDKRIRYYRNNSNIGVENGRKVFSLSSGEYFMWAADHDLWDPTFISTCLKVMMDDPLVVLAYGYTLLIDENDQLIEIMSDRLDTSSLPPEERFKKAIWTLSKCNSLYGLIRSDSIKKIRLAHKVIGADHIILEELSLLGTFVQIEKPLFIRRENRPPENTDERIKRQLGIIFPESKDYLYLPWSHWGYEHLEAVKRADLSNKNKAMLMNEVFKYMKTNRGKLVDNEVENVVKKCALYFVKKELPPEFPFRESLAIDGIKALSMSLPFTSHINKVKYALSLCYRALGIDLDKPCEQEISNCEQIDFDNDSPEKIYNGLQILVNENRPDEAIKGLEKLLEQYPEFAIAHNDLGVLSIKNGNLEKAHYHYEKAVQLQPQNITFQKNLAEYYLNVSGETEKALEKHISVLKEKPNDIETLLALGHICIKHKQLNDAESFFCKVLALDPLNEEAKHGINLLQQCMQADLTEKSGDRKNQINKPVIDCNNFGKEILEAKLDEYKWGKKLELYSPYFDFVNFINTVENPAISIIVISWRLHPDTLKAFELLNLQRNQNFELIFVDNGGQPGEFDILRPFVNTYVKLNQNTGAYLARNLGALFAKAPIFLFLDDDGIPEQNIIEAHLNAFRQYDVIAVRGAIFPKTKDQIKNIPKFYYLGNKPFPTFSCQEGNTSYAANMFIKVGGWDDEIRFGHGGIELSRRLTTVEPDRRKQIYTPKAILYHDDVTGNEAVSKKHSKQEVSLKRLRLKYPDWDNFNNIWNHFLEREDLLIKKENFNKEKLEELNKLNSKGESLFQKGDREGAINTFIEILTIDPNFATAHNNLGVLYHHIGKKEKALEYFKKATEIQPSQLDFLKNLAHFYNVELSSPQKSIEIYIKILDNNPLDLESLLSMGDICLHQNNMNDAKDFFDRVLEIEPTNTSAKKKLQTLQNNIKASFNM